MRRGATTAVLPVMQAAAFPAVLAAPRRAHTPHFVAQHLPHAPVAELSTSTSPVRARTVDERRGWGAVVPKRHARRAVTRNLIRRQLRAAVQRHAAQLDDGLWLLRLRAAFDVKQFPSATSPALRSAVRAEIDLLLVRATGPSRP